MAAPIAKLSVGRTGLGSAHASYITRISALDPYRNEREHGDGPERSHPLVMVDGNPSVPEMTPGEAIEDDTQERPEAPDIRGPSETERDEDPIWTWNAPDYITGDSYGIRPEGAIKPSKNAQAHERTLSDKMGAKPAQTGEKLPLKEKIENAR